MSSSQMSRGTFDGFSALPFRVAKTSESGSLGVHLRVRIRESFDLLTLTEAGTPHHLYS